MMHCGWKPISDQWKAARAKGQECDWVRSPFTADDALKWLDEQAEYYERANNYATRSKRYHREETIAWKTAKLIRESQAALAEIERTTWTEGEAFQKRLIEIRKIASSALTLADKP